MKSLSCNVAFCRGHLLLSSRIIPCLTSAEVFFWSGSIQRSSSGEVVFFQFKIVVSVLKKKVSYRKSDTLEEFIVGAGFLNGLITNDNILTMSDLASAITISSIRTYDMYNKDWSN